VVKYEMVDAEGNLVTVDANGVQKRTPEGYPVGED